MSRRCLSWKGELWGESIHVSNPVNSFSDNNFSVDTLINEELSKLIEWLKINKLSLNKSKSKYMIFHMPKKEIQILTLKIDNTNIDKVEEFNFLGLTIDTQSFKVEKAH